MAQDLTLHLTILFPTKKKEELKFFGHIRPTKSVFYPSQMY